MRVDSIPVCQEFEEQFCCGFLLRGFDQGTYHREPSNYWTGGFPAVFLSPSPPSPKRVASTKEHTQLAHT